MIKDIMTPDPLFRIAAEKFHGAKLYTYKVWVVISGEPRRRIYIIPAESCSQAITLVDSYLSPSQVPYEIVASIRHPIPKNYPSLLKDQAT